MRPPICQDEELQDGHRVGEQDAPLYEDDGKGCYNILMCGDMLSMCDDNFHEFDDNFHEFDDMVAKLKTRIENYKG